MTKTVLRELVRLFVDDGVLALTIAAVVVLSAVSRILLPDMPLATGMILTAGSLLALALSTIIAIRRSA